MGPNFNRGCTPAQGKFSMVVFRLTNFASLVDKGQRLCKIGKGVGALNGVILVEGPLRVDV